MSESLTVHTSFHRHLRRSPSHSLHLASVIFRNRNGFNMVSEFNVSAHTSQRTRDVRNTKSPGL